MVRAGGGIRLLFSLFVFLVASVLGMGSSGWLTSALAVEGKPVVSDGKPVSSDGRQALPGAKVAAPDGRGVTSDVKALPSDGKVSGSDLIPSHLGDLPVEASWKIAVYLLIFIVLAVLVVHLSKRLRPQWRGTGPIFIEDGRNLAPGVGVRLIRVGVRYWLIGVTKEHVTLLAELSEEDLLEEDLDEDVPEVMVPRGKLSRGVQGEEPSLVDRGMRR